MYSVFVFSDPPAVRCGCRGWLKTGSAYEHFHSEFGMRSTNRRSKEEKNKYRKFTDHFGIVDASFANYISNEFYFVVCESHSQQRYVRRIHFLQQHITYVHRSTT